MGETARSSRAFERADARPRVHIREHPTLKGHWRWSIGPTAVQSVVHHTSPGRALDAALDRLAHAGAKGTVVFVEPAHG